jgi:CHAT domain-containing protein
MGAGVWSRQFEPKTTVALTTRMFTEAEKGVGRAEALRRSMLALIDHPTDTTLRHPAMWAPFVVVGEGMAGRIVK